MKKRKIFLSSHAVAGILSILLGVAMLFSSGSKSGIYPRAVFVCMVFFGVYVLAEMTWKGSGPMLEKISKKGVLLILLLFVNPLIGKTLGFYVSGFLTLLGMSSVIDTPKGLPAWIRLILYLLCVTASVYLIFTVLLRIQTPKGILL